MKRITVTLNNQVLFRGNILDVPIKDEWIIQKSLELFADDDPCIIHKSYCIKHFADELLAKLGTEPVVISDLRCEFLALPQDAMIQLEG